MQVKIPPQCSSSFCLLDFSIRGERIESEKEPQGGIRVTKDVFPVLLPVLFHVHFHEQIVASSFKESASENLVCIRVGMQGKRDLQMLLECSRPGHWDGSGLLQVVQTLPTEQTGALPDASERVISSLSGQVDENF